MKPIAFFNTSAVLPAQQDELVVRLQSMGYHVVPTVGGPAVQVVEPVIDRRERIAIAALQGLLSNPEEKNNTAGWQEAYAMCAAFAADGLIEELDK